MRGEGARRAASRSLEVVALWKAPTHHSVWIGFLFPTPSEKPAIYGPPIHTPGQPDSAWAGGPCGWQPAPRPRRSDQGTFHCTGHPARLGGGFPSSRLVPQEERRWREREGSPPLHPRPLASRHLRGGGGFSGTRPFPFPPELTTPASRGVCRGENEGSGARLPGFNPHFGSSLDVILG